MKLQIKKICYKILVVTMITVVLSFFSASSVSQAKLRLKEGEFYYSGTQDGTYVVGKNLWDSILETLGEIANYLLGIKTLGIRMVIVGWIEIMEILLTAILGVEIDLASFFSEALEGMDTYSQQIVNVETIIFNRVPILNANIFTAEKNDDRNSEEITEKTIKKGNKIVKSIKESVAKWYYVMRLIVIAFMLILLIFIGIKMAISTIASEKSVYKQMLIDWVAGMIIVFSIHYIMIAILTINDTIVDAISPLAQEPVEIQEVDKYGDKEKLKNSSQIETTLYESARTRAYSMKLTDGFTGMIFYAVLVYFAWRFALIYLRRIINIIILTLMAPAVAASYAFNKVLTGKPKVFSTWFSEYIMNVIIQIFHVLVYVSFVSTALVLSLESLPGAILAFVLLNFMIKADKLLRKLFKFSGGKGSLAGDMADKTDFKQLQQDAKSLKSNMVGGTIATKAMKATYALPKAVMKKAGIELLSNTVAAARNNEHYKKYQKEKEEAADNQRQEDAKKYLENNEEAIKKNKEIDELEEKKRKLLEEREVLKSELGYYKRKKADEQIDETKKKLEENQTEIKEIDKDIKKKEDEIQEGFLRQQISSSGSIIGTIKGNLREAFDELVEQGEDGKYRSKKVRTLRRGGVKGAFWREEVDSKKMRFKSKMKVATLLGLDSSEEKLLKSEMDFWKNRIIALGSAVAGMPLLVTNPLAGMALLSKAGITHLDVKTRRRRYKNAKRLQNKTYIFKTFGGEGVNRLSRAQSYHLLEMHQLEALENKKVNKEVKDVVKFAKEMEKREKNIKGTAKQLASQYTQNLSQFEDEIKKDASAKSIEDLAFEQKVRENNVVNVGDGVCMQLQTNIAMKKFMDKVEDIEARKDLSAKDKADLVNKAMSEQKGFIIKEAIGTLCTQNGITDINKLQLTDAEMVQINQNILGMLEQSGVVKKGHVDLEKANINEQTISTAYLDLTTDYEATNKELKSKLASSAILEYMEKKGEKDVRNLNTDEAKEEIYNIMKGKLMPESSKESASVIAKLTGKDKIKEEFELPEDVKNMVGENIKKVKKIRKRRFSKRSRKTKIGDKRSKHTKQSNKR